MPLLRGLCRATGLDGLRAGRLLDALSGGAGILLTYGITRRMVARSASAGAARFAATLAAVGLALSYGYWVEAADVEAYSLATVALLATVRLALSYGERPTWTRAAVVGLALGVAVLTHLSHVLLSVFVGVSLTTGAATRRRGLAHAATALLAGGSLALGAYGYAAFVVRRHDLAGAVKWVLTASHGFHDGGGLYRLADGVYGLAKALVYAPYLYEADAPKLLGQFLLGLAPLVAIGIALARARPMLDYRTLGAWTLPYAALALFFFGSDSERWIFVLPALFIVAGARLAGDPRRRALGLAACGYLALVNLGTGIWPAHRDSGVRSRAQAAASLLRDGDLAVFPGHSWDEYVGFYGDRAIEPFPIAYYAARDGVDAGFRRLELELARAAARGGRVFALRVYDDDDEDPRGFAELKQLGLDRARLRALVGARLAIAERLRVEDLTVVRLEPNAPERSSAAAADSAGRR
jgi:hypothetical protein